MLPLIVSALSAWLMGVLLSLNAEYQDIYHAYLMRTVEHDVTWWGETLQGYQQSVGSYPNSLSTIQSRTDYAETRTWNTTWLGYAATATSSLNDGVWRYQRATVFEALPQDYALAYMGATSATNQLLSENRCGSASFSSDAYSWCARSDLRWWRGESREGYVQLLTAQRLAQQNTVAKILNYISVGQTLPLADGAVYSLPALVDASLQATNCHANYSISTIPFDCQDLFSLTGQPIYYQALSATRFALQNDTGLVRSNGTKIYVTTFVDLPI